MTTVSSFIQKNKFTILAVVAILGACVIGALTADHAFAQIFDPNRDLPDSIANAGGDRSLREVILLAINFVLGFVGLIAVIMLIWGGFQYMVNGADDQEKPRNIIIYAIVGILIILFSFAIVNTVFDVTTGSDTTGGGI